MLRVVHWDRHAARRLAVRSFLAEAETDSSGRPAREFLIGPYRAQSYRERYTFDGVCSCRDVLIVLRSAARIVAAAKFSEWRIPPLTPPYDFWTEADGMSLEDSHLAEIICSFWPWDAWPPDYGNVAVFSRLAIDTASSPDRSTLSALRGAIDVEFGRRVSAIVLKAFPLEFEHVVDEDNVAEFERRKVAMRQHYARRLQAKPFGDDAYRDFMWLSVRWCPDPSPTSSRDWVPA